MNTLAKSNLIDFIIYEYEISRLQDALIILSGVVGMMLLSKLSFYLPFTPVPITAQSFGILLIGASFGMKRAFLSSLTYVGAGIFGLPVFSGGKFGLIAITGPTGGYIIGFIVAATIMGLFGDNQKDRKFISSILSFLVGHLIIFSFGLLWLLNFVPIEKVFISGLYPFIPGMVIKTLLAGIISPLIWNMLNKRNGGVVSNK